MSYNRKKKKELFNYILQSRREMDDMQGLFTTDQSSERTELSIQASPIFHVEEKEAYYKVNGDIENITVYAIEFDIKNKRFFIVGKRKHINTLKYEEWQWEEEHYSNYKRSFILPDDADYKRITMRFHNGILQIKIPKIV
jgi:HSP20 family protein